MCLPKAGELLWVEVLPSMGEQCCRPCSEICRLVGEAPTKWSCAVCQGLGRLWCLSSEPTRTGHTLSATKLLEGLPRTRLLPPNSPTPYMVTESTDYITSHSPSNCTRKGNVYFEKLLGSGDSMVSKQAAFLLRGSLWPRAEADKSTLL